ncbi:hypothetical protein EDD21DRAFT_418528 [Dissophora ornata]|nr:hypothetical protein EDD21DRAFT_418528 [Dissophora ornata]
MVGAMYFYKSDMYLAQQRQMSGMRGHGPVDRIHQNRFTEVKKDDQIQGLAQNMDGDLVFRTKEIPGILELELGEKELRVGCEKIFGHVLALYDLMKDDVNRSAYGRPTSGSLLSNKRIATGVDFIKTKKTVQFSDVDVDQLTLWLVKTPEDKEDSPVTVDALEGKTELKHLRTCLSELLPDGPDNNTYIVMQRPQAGKAVPYNDVNPELANIINGANGLHRKHSADAKGVGIFQRKTLGPFYKRPLPYNTSATGISLAMLGRTLRWAFKASTLRSRSKACQMISSVPFGEYTVEIDLLVSSKSKVFSPQKDAYDPTTATEVGRITPAAISFLLPFDPNQCLSAIMIFVNDFAVYTKIQVTQKLNLSVPDYQNLFGIIQKNNHNLIKLVPSKG